MLNNSSGTGNTAIGDSALHSNTVGSENAAIGRSALLSNTVGSDIVAVGASAGQKITSADHVIRIGHFGENVTNSCYIGHIFGATIDPAGALVGIDASGNWAPPLRRDAQV
jgi:hypothetical protein